MTRIAVIAPNAAIAEGARAALASVVPPVPVHVGLMEEGVRIAAELIAREHPRVLISRGGTALLLRRELPIHVVEIKISLADAAGALLEARRFGRKILFLGFSNHIAGVSSLGSVTGLEIHEKVLDCWQDAPSAVAAAKAEGFDAIVGGATQQEAAADAGMPFVFLRMDGAAVLAAHREAAAVVDALGVEERKAQEMRTLLDVSRDGFVAVDSGARITLVNNSAAAMLGVDPARVAGLPIRKALPGIAGLSEALAGRQPGDEIIALAKTSVLCQRLPLKHGGRVVGAMATLRNVDAVRSDEGRIRLAQYQDGLYANCRFSDIVGESAAIAGARRQAAEFARVDATVLITSESGTGKEMFAQSIHNDGARTEGPFVGINCASLSASILESELFGYVDGAFTGARRGGKAGVFELANNGTIFLDEIGELPLAVQGKLLRVLQERCVMRLGATRIVPVNVRVIAATNLDLVGQVRRGRFRKDLFFRLDVLRLGIPPLRERREDIPALAALFLRKYGGERGRALSRGHLALLRTHSWPGNIRELENLMERLGVYPEEEHGRIIARHFEDMAALSPQPPASAPDADAIRAALAASKGNKRKAAELLRIHRSTLYRMLGAK